MTEKPTSTEALGIEIDSHSLKGAELKLIKGSPQIINLFEVMIDRAASTPANVKLLYNEDEKSRLALLLDANLVITTLPTPHVLVRQLEVNLTSDKDIESVLEFQAEPLIPFPLEEGFLDRIVQSKQTESTLLTILASRMSSVSAHLDRCKSIDIEPEAVTCIPAALANFSKVFSSLDTPHLVLHLGFDCITCAVVENGKLIAAQSTENGIGELSEVSGEVKNRQLESLSFDIKRIAHSLAKQIPEKDSAGIIMTGDGVDNIPLTNAISENLELNIIPLKENSSSQFSELKLQKFAVPIGSSLSAISKDFNQINFRQGDLSYPFPWKRVKRPLITFIAFSLLTATAFYILGTAYLTRQEDLIREKYVELLAYMKKPYTEFEEKFTGKTVAQEHSVLNLSKEEISERINLLEKEVRGNPDLFPLLPNTPRVSDVLAWLATHPHILGEYESGSPSEPRIQLTSFSYKMINRPEETKKRAKYQARVEIEFTTPTPRFAREFHDILLSPNDIVDPAGEVKWGTERGKYRASFLLKDKTLYPQ